MRSIAVHAIRAVLLLLGLASCAGSSDARQAGPPLAGPVHRFSLEIRSSDTLVRLPHEFLLAGSESVRLGGRLLVPGRDYALDARAGTLRIEGSILRSAAADSGGAGRLEGTYRSLPLLFLPEYRRRRPEMLVDTGAGARISASPERVRTPFTFDDVFGSTLQKSGSIVRGFSIGSNRDLSLNSGFRMQMAGKLTDDLELTAALTDENSPIQPEGTTQTLQEFDKVFVEIKGSDVQGTFGDLLLDVRGGEFSRFSRKLQGAKGAVRYGTGANVGELMAAAAATRGKYATNELRGLDGVQGPYRLVGKENERDIIVIAGTERVYLNGELVTRGENQAYVIDYATAEVTFTPRRLISHSTRIVVDFEYSDRQFNRTLVGAQAGAAMAGGRFSIRAGIFRESDDQDSPIDNSLSDADRDTLRLAGDDRTLASRSGAVDVGAGRGQYVRRDTLVLGAAGDTVLLPVYRYAPFDTVNAAYAVTFTHVGAGRGDYAKVSSGNFRFAGVGLGSYAPVRFLPRAQSHALIDVGLSGRLTDDLTLSGEFAGSSFDRNRFSGLDDGDNDGSALNLAIRYAPDSILVGETNLGSMVLTLRERRVGRRFAPLDRVDDVEFSRRWNLADSSDADEEIREGLLTYTPGGALTLAGGMGRIDRGDLFSSRRYSASADLRQPELPTAGYAWELIDSRDQAGGAAGTWVRHGGDAKRKFGVVTPSVGYRSELLRSSDLAGDSLLATTFQFSEIVPGVAFDSIGPMSARAALGVRWDDSLRGGSLERVSVTTTQTYGWSLEPWRDLSSSVDLTVQHRSFTEAFRQRNGEDRESILLRWQTRFTPLDRGVETDWFYEASSEQAAKQERVFQRVVRGTGNYVYAGDLNGNTTVDEQDFQLARFDGDFIALTVPTDALTPVVGVKASTRIRVTPSRFVGKGGGIGPALAWLSSETYARVEERSSETDTRQIYLLRLSRFLSDATTLEGSNLVTQDLHVRENRPEFSLRFRFSQRRAVTQFATLAERAYARERSMRLRWKFLDEIANQVDLVEKADLLAASELSVRERSVRSTTILSDWSYRPVQDVEAGFRVEVGSATNSDTTEASINAEALRCVYSIRGKGQLRAELTREEVTLRRAGDLVPFELTAGRVRGKSWLWRVGLEYRLTQFIQGFLSYDGRSEGEGVPVHTARAEVRAFF